MEVIAEKGCTLIGESLISLGKKLTSRVLICAVQRGDHVVIPSGSFIIEEGDKIHFTADVKNLGDFLTEVNLVKSPYVYRCHGRFNCRWYQGIPNCNGIERCLYQCEKTNQSPLCA